MSRRGAHQALFSLKFTSQLGFEVLTRLSVGAPVDVSNLWGTNCTQMDLKGILIIIPALVWRDWSYTCTVFVPLSVF